MTRCAIAGLALMLCGTALGGTPIEDLKACAARADAPEAEGKKLLDLCPGILANLSALGLDSQFTLNPNREVDSQVLEDLAALVEHYSGRPASKGPAITHLPGIAEEVNGKKTATSPDWWERAKQWLQRWFGRDSAKGGSWLSQLFERMGESQRFLHIMVYVGVGLVLAAALAVVVNELRAAGVWPFKQNLGAQQRTSAALLMPVALAEEARVPGPLSGLLISLVERLVRGGRLRAERALTHRELIARSQLDTRAQAQVFARVAMSAEAALYGPDDYRVPDEVIAEGRALLHELERSEVPP